MRTDAGDDNVGGKEDHDVLKLGSGDDRAFGGDGDDFIAGGRGSDFMDGGDGNDILVLAKTAVMLMPRAKIISRP